VAQRTRDRGYSLDKLAYVSAKFCMLTLAGPIDTVLPGFTLMRDLKI